jgi:hypothetical protein
VIVGGTAVGALVAGGDVGLAQAASIKTSTIIKLTIRKCFDIFPFFLFIEYNTVLATK